MDCEQWIWWHYFRLSIDTLYFFREKTDTCSNAISTLCQYDEYQELEIDQQLYRNINEFRNLGHGELWNCELRDVYLKSPPIVLLTIVSYVCVCIVQLCIEARRTRMRTKTWVLEMQSICERSELPPHQRYLMSSSYCDLFAKFSTPKEIHSSPKGCTVKSQLVKINNKSLFIKIMDGCVRTHLGG